MQYVSLEEGERNTEGNERRRRGKDESENQQQTQQRLRFEASLFWWEACAVSYTCTSPHPMEVARLILSQTILWALMINKKYFRCICRLSLA